MTGNITFRAVFVIEVPSETEPWRPGKTNIPAGHGAQKAILEDSPKTSSLSVWALVTLGEDQIWGFKQQFGLILTNPLRSQNMATTFGILC